MNTKKIPLIRVNQWLSTWDKAHWKEEKGLGKPSGHFYIGSMSLEELRGLAGVTQRTIAQRKKRDAIHGYQRAHEETRSKKINKYVNYGYPLSTSVDLDPSEHEELINPGWLPNAIIVNIIPVGEKRNRGGKDVEVPSELEVKVSKMDGDAFLCYPSTKTIQAYRASNNVFTEPVEIIDGQHRLFALDYEKNINGEYQVPVVVFNNLSLSWQAYLFWTINVEPKKINASLAFDLYPELRRQEWLEKSEAIKIYQEHRSQEMTEILWSHPDSPWYDRIELHGRRVKGHVSNAAFIRSLNGSFIKKWVLGDRIGGLFGSVANKDGSGNRVIPWKRAQQAAFLIKIWQSVCNSIKKSDAQWVSDLKGQTQGHLLHNLPPAFSGEHSLLATDQGVRAIHNIFNAVFQHDPDAFDLQSWQSDDVMEESPSEERITQELRSLEKLKTVNQAIRLMSDALINGFDWRLSSAPGLDDQEKKIQGSYRGSSGYSLMMQDLIKVLSKNDRSPEVQKIAKEIGGRLIKK